MDRNIIETKIAELETAKKNKSVAEGAIISAQADLEKATQEVENLSEMVKGLISAELRPSQPVAR